MAAIDHRSDSTPVSLGPSLARSPRFTALFAEGMALVEEAATYLDGPGRAEAATLRPGLKAAYAAESMRLTTRLMQLASWLLVRRAMVGGEMKARGGDAERPPLALTAQETVSSPLVLRELPETLQGLIDRSMRLQSRILHIDRMVTATLRGGVQPVPAPSGVDRQLALLHSAFSTPR